MDPTEHRQKEDGQTPTTRMATGASIGLVTGILWGSMTATPEVPVMISKLKIGGCTGLACAALGSVWVGVEMLLENYRKRKDFFNSSAGGFVAGASYGVLSHQGRSIAVPILGGIVCAQIPPIVYSIKATIQKSHSDK